jgi:serine/threonine-protein kinase
MTAVEDAGRSALQPAPVPCVLGRYTIHQQIASGGLGSVHFARLVGPSGFARTVAAKRPHPHLIGQRDFALMFVDEARLAARIRHPNVVSTRDVIQTPTDLLLIMEYVHGESLAALHLASRARNERASLPVAASIVTGALHGLHAAHEATDEQGEPLGIVHRDVSPQNILVGVDGVARLADFGIAKAAGRLQATTGVAAIKGKCAYMAPEQVLGEPVSRATDTFAAAIVFWELLTGERLFLGQTDAETVHRILHAPVRCPGEIVDDVPSAIDDVLRKALSRDPSSRYQTARELALDIEASVPPVRMSEVGAWVERMAGEVLAERAAILAQIERGEVPRLRQGHAVVRAQRAERQRLQERAVREPPTQTALVSATPSQPDRQEAAGAAYGGAPGNASSGQLRWRTAVLMMGVLAGLVVASAGIVARKRSTAAPAAAAHAVPLVAATREAPSLASATPAASEGEQPAALGSASSSPGGGAREATKPPSPAASSQGGHRGVKGAAAASGACSPPYTIDAEGFRKYKIECL